MQCLHLLALPESLGSSICLPLEMLNATNNVLQRQRKSGFSCQIVGVDKAPVQLSGGMQILPDTCIEEVSPGALVLIPSLWRHPERAVHRHPELVSWLRGAAVDTSLVAVGTGSFILAETGLLDDCAATTHWAYLNHFARAFPKVQLKRDHLMTEANNRYCAGSVNSVADLMVHWIQQRWGSEVAGNVEQQFSPEIRRPFVHKAYQHGMPGSHSDEAIAAVQSWLHQHWQQRPSNAALAEHCGLSLRSLLRRFRQATELSPQQYAAQLRHQHAKELLRDTDLNIAEVAASSAFHDASELCRQFKKHAGLSPAEYRRVVRKKLFDSA